MRNLSRVRADEPVRLIAQPVRISIWAVAGAWLGRRLIRLLVLIVTTPAALAAIAVVVAGGWVWRHVNPILVIAALVLAAAGLIVWRVRWPAGFLRWVRLPMRGWRRGWWVYRRRWTAAMDTANLTITRHTTEYVPPILRVRSTLSVDRVRVRMLAGQTLDDYATVAPRLAQTFGAADCRIRSVPKRVHEADLWLLTRDPLREVVQPMPAELDPLGRGLPVALAEDGNVWRLQLVGSHVLVVGATGAGKGSVIWSLLIPDNLPGVGYVAVDGIAEPVRVRFSRITDHTIRDIATPGEPAEPATVLQLVGGEAA